MWATVLKLESMESDFLACRSEIEIAAAKPESDAALAAKARQADYKQLRKDLNKARKEKLRLGKKQALSGTTIAYPLEVETALTYFSDNGFELSDSLEIENVAAARKTLSRIFHPDKGGTHEEILTLNENYDALASYLGH